MYQKSYLTVSEAAKLLDANAATIRKSIKNGIIQAIKLGNSKNSSYRIPCTEIERLLKGIPIDRSNIFP